MIRVTAPTRIDISAGWSDANPFQSDFGGAVLNAAINLRVSATLKGKDLINSLDSVPTASGLGTSGALRTAYLVAANPDLVKDKVELIKRVHTFENAIVGQRAGYQDQAAAVFGGVNYWEFRKNGGIKRVQIPKSKVNHLYDRLVLVYTGDRHQSSDVHGDVFSRTKGYMRIIPAIERMSVLAKKMADNITNEKKMAYFLKETWVLQTSLHKGMESPAMKKLQQVCTDCYLACRATGAGGGGCMLFYTKPEKKRNLVGMFDKMRKRLPNMRVLPFEFDYRGIELKKS